MSYAHLGNWQLKTVKIKKGLKASCTLHKNLQRALAWWEAETNVDYMDNMHVQHAHSPVKNTFVPNIKIYD